MLWKPLSFFHNPHSLWKTHVENSVENVENYELSTGIPPFWKFHTACGKDAQEMPAIPGRLPKNACYVTTVPKGLLREFIEKSLQIVKFPCQILSHSDTAQKFFVKNSQRNSRVSFFHNRGILDVSGKKGKLPFVLLWRGSAQASSTR